VVGNEKELLLFYPLTHIAFEGHPAHDTLIHLNGEEAVIGLPFGFGMVHCGIGSFEKSFLIQAVIGINSNADTGARVDLSRVYRK
jgi:hypothetical protein